MLEDHENPINPKSMIIITDETFKFYRQSLAYERRNVLRCFFLLKNTLRYAKHSFSISRLRYYLSHTANTCFFFPFYQVVETYK